MNDNCESMSHVFKQACTWKSLKPVEVVEILYGVVKAKTCHQASGEFILAEVNKKLSISRDEWHKLNKTQKDRKFKKFTNTCKEQVAYSVD